MYGDHHIMSIIVESLLSIKLCQIYYLMEVERAQSHYNTLCSNIIV